MASRPRRLRATAVVGRTAVDVSGSAIPGEPDTARTHAGVACSPGGVRPDEPQEMAVDRGGAAAVLVVVAGAFGSLGRSSDEASSAQAETTQSSATETTPPATTKPTTSTKVPSTTTATTSTAGPTPTQTLVTPVETVTQARTVTVEPATTRGKDAGRDDCGGRGTPYDRRATISTTPHSRARV